MSVVLYWELKLSITMLKAEGDKSLADDLNMERGIVSSRVAFVATIC